MVRAWSGLGREPRKLFACVIVEARAVLEPRSAAHRAETHQRGGGSEHATRRRRRAHVQQRRTGGGRATSADPLLVCRPRLLAFQLPAYTEHFSCIAIDLPGTGESDKPPGPYSTDGHADQVAAFLGAIGIERAHVAGMSFGAAVGIHLAARHPGRVRPLSLHGGWHASDDYLKLVVEQWRTLATTLPTVADVVIGAIFPWCFTPDMFVGAARVCRHAGGLRA